MDKKLTELFPTIAFPDDSKKKDDNSTKPIDPQKKDDQNKKQVLPPTPTDPNDSRRKSSDLNHISLIGWLVISILLVAILSIAGMIFYKARQLKISSTPAVDLNETIDLSYQPSQRASSFLNDTQPIK